MQVERDFILEPVCRLLQRPKADGAPGAGKVRNKIDLEGGGHGSSLWMASQDGRTGFKTAEAAGLMRCFDSH